MSAAVGLAERGRIAGYGERARRIVRRAGEHGVDAPPRQRDGGARGERPSCGVNETSLHLAHTAALGQIRTLFRAGRTSPVWRTVPLMASVLVVEDDQFVRSALIRHLTEASHTVRSVGTALRRCARLPMSASMS
jgi:hypothetical protein